jgi:hypothetical protein
MKSRERAEKRFKERHITEIRLKEWNTEKRR